MRRNSTRPILRLAASKPEQEPSVNAMIDKLIALIRAQIALKEAQQAAHPIRMVVDNTKPAGASCPPS